MFTAYVVVTFLTAIIIGISATLSFIRFKPVMLQMAKAGVPETWVNMLGTLKAAGAIGLLVGFFIPQIGMAATVGLILFFIGAIITHLRARDNQFGYPSVYFLLAVTVLVLRLVTA